MELFKDKGECFGCSACSQICPKKAITMKRDQKGFLYPEINAEMCINCGLCKRVCPIGKNVASENEIRSVYALQHKNTSVLKKSSSGGAFIALSDIILKRGGAVYGAVLDKSDFLVVHKCATNETERDFMCGSKYVQSDTNKVFVDVKNRLKIGAPVLFTGTPCQNTGLLTFLGEHPSNLYLMDVICHGTPSNKLLCDHVDYLERRNKCKIKDFHFRSKRYAYSYAYSYACEYLSSDGKLHSQIENKRLIKMFTYNMRQSCYECPFASMDRVGDITVGDLWQPEKYTDITNALGVSVILTNNSRGEYLVDMLRNSCELRKLDLSCVESRQALSHPVPYTPEIDCFWNDYFTHGYEYVLDKYAPQRFISTVYNVMWRLIFHLRLHKIAFRIGLI